jgi:site-specific DNA-methyltransferase (adenine-specific)
MRIALDTDRVSLVQGDTLEVLRSFADKSFDVIVADPPYDPHVHANLGKERRNDGVEIRAELTFPPMTPELILQVMAQYVRVCRGWIISFSDFYNSHRWGQAAIEMGGAWVRTGQWVKTNPMPQMTGDRPGAGSEDIVIAHAKARGWEWNGRGKAATWRGRRDDGYGETPHPNQKPAWLLQSLIGMFCPPGGLVLDPYFGSGTTAIAALAQERLEGESALETSCPKCAKKILEQYQPPMPENVRVVGIEGDPRYVALSISRIREAAPSLLAA